MNASNPSLLHIKDNSLWRATKRLLAHKQIPSPLRTDFGNWVRSSQDKATLLGIHLSHVFKNHPESHTDHSLKVISELSVPLPKYLKDFNPTDMEYIIKRLPQKRAPDFDLITPRILHHLPP